MDGRGCREWIDHDAVPVAPDRMIAVLERIAGGEGARTRRPGRYAFAVGDSTDMDLVMVAATTPFLANFWRFERPARGTRPLRRCGSRSSGSSHPVLGLALLAKNGIADADELTGSP